MSQLISSLQVFRQKLCYLIPATYLTHLSLLDSFTRGTFREEYQFCDIYSTHNYEEYCLLGAVRGSVVG
jgi:hypothetical protein